jgi:hypothetical protein
MIKDLGAPEPGQRNPDSGVKVMVPAKLEPSFSDKQSSNDGTLLIAEGPNSTDMGQHRLDLERKTFTSFPLVGRGKRRRGWEFKFLTHVHVGMMVLYRASHRLNTLFPAHG